MKRSRDDDNKRDTPEPDKLTDLLNAIIEDADILKFAELFRRQRDNRLPVPIKNLLLWHQKYPDEIYVTKNSQTQELELCIDRISLMKQHQVPLTVMQCFERCLLSVKPKMVVIQTTHGHDIKKFALLKQ
jgi:hypothetical protein